VFGLRTVHFFDILSDATRSITAIFFFGGGGSCGESSPYFSVTAGEYIGGDVM
jgi:uncharacterized protein (DUF779 family)